MNVLGVKIVGHDTGAALISNGRVVAIAEERLNRVKHSPNMFPRLSIDYCLKVLGVKSDEVDCVVIDRVKFTNEEYDPVKEFKNHTANTFSKAIIHVINHQDAHAASAFFASPFEEAGILIYDGSGEKFKNHTGVMVVETDTMYRGYGNSIFQIQKTAHAVLGNDFKETIGIGRLYTKLSEKYIGFGRYNEGKMMGLASYGDDGLLKKFPENYWFREERGHIVCNGRIDFPPHPFLADLKRTKFQKLPAFLFYRLRLLFPFGKLFGSKQSLFPQIVLPRPSRSNEKLPDKYYSQVAYAGQKILEKVTLFWAKKLWSIVKLENVAIAGGVGLNIDANRQILEQSGFKHIFIQPAASDTGIALGSALWGYHMILKKPRFFVMHSASLGKAYSTEEVRRAVEKFKEKIQFIISEAPFKEAAKLISEGNIIGWFQGGSEYGPRALGNRSIVCDPRKKDMRDVLNARIKHREMWRPFAASVLRDRMTEFFDLNYDSPFMILCANVHKERRTEIPAVVHVDGTCRVQTVTKEHNGRYFDLISEFHKLTGVPLLLNTSFNLGGDPIVETPEDAIDSFLRTDMDFLILENYIIKKK